MFEDTGASDDWESMVVDMRGRIQQWDLGDCPWYHGEACCNNKKENKSRDPALATFILRIDDHHSFQIWYLHTTQIIQGRVMDQFRVEFIRGTGNKCYMYAKRRGVVKSESNSIVQQIGDNKA